MRFRTAFTVAGITILAALGMTAPAAFASVQHPAVHVAAQQPASFPTGDIWCDGSQYRECVNLRGGSCTTGAVVQGWPYENGDSNERLNFQPAESNKTMIQFSRCGSAWCAYHSTIRGGFAAVYLGVCNAYNGADLWGFGRNNYVWTFNAGGYLTATLSNGNQLITENLLINQAYWYAASY